MAKGTVNKVIIMGRLGADPEIRQLQNGNAVANVSIATNDGYKDKQTGQYIDVTEWHRVVIFNKMADVVQQYCKKGSQLYVEGRIRTNKWQDQNGQDRYTTEVVATEIQLMGGKNQSDESNQQNNIATPSNQPINSNSGDYAKEKGGKPSQSEFNDDDIPF